MKFTGLYTLILTILGFSALFVLGYVLILIAGWIFY